MKFDMNGSQAVIRQTSVSYQAVIRQFSGSRQIVMYLKGLYIIMYFLQKDDIMLHFTLSESEGFVICCAAYCPIHLTILVCW